MLAESSYEKLELDKCVDAFCELMKKRLHDKIKEGYSG